MDWEREVKMLSEPKMIMAAKPCHRGRPNRLNLSVPNMMSS